MEIGKLSKKDIPAAASIANEATSGWHPGWAKLVSGLIRGEPGQFRIQTLVAKREGEVLGLIVLKKEICATVIYFLGVKKGERGKGAGSLLLKAAEKNAGKSGCSFLRVDVYSRFRENIRFYRKNGFRMCGRVRNFYEPGDSQVFLFKKMGQGTPRSPCQTRAKP